MHGCVEDTEQWSAINVANVGTHRSDTVEPPFSYTAQEWEVIS